MSAGQTEPTASKPKGSAWPYVISVLVLLFVVGLWIGTYYVITRNFKDNQWGIIGDLFGAINALFSGLAFAGVVFALFLQRADLKLQQEQLKRSSDELSNQTKAVIEQLAVLREANELEKIRQKNEMEPSFQWLGTSSDPAMKKCEFANRGGRFKLIEISGHPAIRIAPTPSRNVMMHHGDKGWLVIQHRRQGEPLPSEKIWFTLHCELPNGTRINKDFDILAGENTPKEKGR